MGIKKIIKLTILDKWINSVANPFLSESLVLSPIAAETTEFTAKHKSFLTEITVNLVKIFEVLLNFRKTKISSKQSKIIKNIWIPPNSSN